MKLNVKAKNDDVSPKPVLGIGLVTKPIIVNTVPKLVPKNKEFEGGFEADTEPKPVTPKIESKSIVFSKTPKLVPKIIDSVTDTESEIETEYQHDFQAKEGYEGPSVRNIKRYDDRKHVYVKQGMYIGSDKSAPREEWLYDFVEKKIIKKKIDFVPGCERIFLEILSNASDAAGRSRRHGVNPGKIIIKMDNKTISIKSHGEPMPVEEHPDEKLWGPELNFGCLRTGENLEGERNEIGTNGIGSKATNIFSLKFTAIIYDHIRMKRYEQVWDTNMINVSVPDIQPYPGKTSSVEVIYEMDFARFGYPIPEGDIGGYPKEAMELFARHAMDTSFTAKIPVIFNDLEFQFSNIRDYGRMYFGDAVETAIVHYQWPENTEIINKRKGYQVAKNPSILPLVELLAVDTPDDGNHVSFVNCMMTRQGGIHIDSAFKAVGSGMVKMINENMMKELIKINKGKELDSKDKRAHTISLADVKPHISILLNTHLKNVDFDSQSKTKLTDSNPKPKIKIDENELKGISKWELKERLLAALEAKQYKSLAKTAGDKKYKAKNVLHANDSKSNDPKVRHSCTLYITEGDSGDCYATTLVGLTPNGRNKIGCLPMRGKGLNVMNARLFRIERNPEFKELNAALGLIPGTDYSIEANFNKLKYGKLMIMADSDVDGKHITGLILNYFHCCFPALLKRGFVDNYITPIISVTRGRDMLKFYSVRSYNKWKATVPVNEKWEHKYYKGLGSSKDEDVEYDKEHPFIIHCDYDAKAKDYFELAFHKKLTNNRKEWITNHIPPIDDYANKLQPISWFIDNELVLYSLDSLPRTIAKMTDGQKESQTKIIHGMHKKWSSGSGKEVKIAQFAGYVAGKTCYHHGETILGGTITKMTQDFTGANNISYFYKGGQTGSFFKGGRDAANPRYTHTKPMPILSYIFSKKDQPLLKHKEEEGEEIEPETYITVVPMVLINGTTGIATGWSSSVPSHNPLDIVKLLRLLLDDVTDLPPLIPWYRGFKGTIEVIDKKKNLLTTKKEEDKKAEKKDETSESEEEPEEFKNDGFRDDIGNEEENDSSNEDDENPKEKESFSIKSRGIFEVDNKGKIIVTEMPVGRWPFNYNKWLEDLKDEKKIKDFNDLSGKDNAHFEIFGFKGTPTYKSLKLEKGISTSNMVLLDPNLRPKKYGSAIEILKAFYEWRLPLYQKRKDHILKVLNDSITFLNYKVQFIQAVIDKSIVVIDTSPAIVHEAVDKLGIPYEVYKKSKTYSLNKEGIAECLEEIKKKEQEKLVVENTTIKEMWLQDLDEFERAYLREYADKKEKKVTKGRGKATASIKVTPKTPSIFSDKQAQEQAKSLFAKGNKSPVIVSKKLTLNNKPVEKVENIQPTVKATIPIFPAKIDKVGTIQPVEKLIIEQAEPKVTIPIFPAKIDTIQPVISVQLPTQQPVIKSAQPTIMTIPTIPTIPVLTPPIPIQTQPTIPKSSPMISIPINIPKI